MSVKLDIHGLNDLDVKKLYGSKISSIYDSVKSGEAKGSEMTGWIEWVNKDHSELIEKTLEIKEDWKKRGVEIVVVIGTGGSYIGCRAGLEFCNSSWVNSGFRFIFVPYFSERYLFELLEFLKDKKFGIVVISKSGTTLESAVGFRLIRELLFEQMSDGYEKNIIAITDKSKGVLREIADKRNIRSFVIEDDIGGRYSTLTSVGLVPMILAGIDVKRVLNGAQKAYEENFNGDIERSSAALYASVRHCLFDKKGLVSECFCSYDPQMRFCMEKMKQLFAESEGKEGVGIMPIIMDFTPDLHSVGQLIQDGKKSFFMSTLMVKEAKYALKIAKSNFSDDDKLDWLAGKTLKEINGCAFEGTLYSHSQLGNIPNLVIHLSNWDPETFGYFYYWVSLSAMFSSYLFGVNPFDQPGVEAYKKRMFELLKK